MKKRKNLIEVGKERQVGLLIYQFHKKRTNRRKEVAHNLKKKHLSVLYKDFKPVRFDDIEDYEK
jgi:hypothetical protein